MVVLLGSQVWNAWTASLTDNQRAEQVVAASRQIFTALINQRTDRSTTQRLWGGRGIPDRAKMKIYLKGLRDGEMPALAASNELLALR